MKPQRLAELDSRSRRRAIARSTIEALLTWIVLVGGYYILPIGHERGTRLFLRLSIAVAVVGLVLVRQMRKIVTAALPELRAGEAIGLTIPLFLFVFAAIYLSLSRTSAVSFSEPLNHTKALYFT